MRKDRFVSMVAFLGAFLGAACPALAQLNFSSANIGAGNGPTQVIPVDVNGDGYMDLVCANYGFSSVEYFGNGGGDGTTLSVFTNDGAGNLTLSATLNAEQEPVSIAAADVNGDGSPDLICANVGNNSLTVFTNDGKGNFTLSGEFPVGAAPVCVVAADVNGDGFVDLISADFKDDTLVVLTNDGHGSFKMSTEILTGPDPNCVAAADFNGDGKVDLVCANVGNSTLQTFTNNGRGDFSLSATISVKGGGPTWVVATDVDRNGSIDLVTAANSSTLNVLTNNGRGQFSLKSAPTSLGASLTVWAADMNGDGIVDLVCPNNGNGVQGSATILTNDGYGNFTINTTIPIGLPGSINYPNYAAAADFNGDGNNDVVVSCYGTANITELTQVNVAARPKTTLISPRNDSVFPLTENFEIVATAQSANSISIVLFYHGTNILGDSTNAPFTYTVSSGALPAGSQAVQAVAIDSKGNRGWSQEIQVNITSSKAEPPPVVNITTPTNGATFLTTDAIGVKATASSGIRQVSLYVDGDVFATTASEPYSFQIPAGTLSVGSHALQAIALNDRNVSGASAVVNIMVNTPGTVLIDFDALNTSAGAVGGTLLANYLAGYGVTVDDVTAGTSMEAVNTNNLTASIQVEVPSDPNFFTQAGSDQAMGFTLRFEAPLQSFGFTRAGLSAPSGLVSHPQWTAAAFDGNGVELGSVTEGLIVSASSVPEKAFVLTGNGIASVRFDSDSQQTAAFSAVLLDNLVLKYTPAAPVLSVALAVTSPATNDIVAPATLTLNATVTDQLSSSYSVSFFAGANLLGTVNASPYQLTVAGVLPGHYDLQAEVVDESELAAQSQVVPITVQVEPDSTLVNFDALNANRGAVEGTLLKNYLSSYGMTAAGLSPGTELAVENQQTIAGGEAVLASSPPNVLTQTGSSGPVQFTLRFAPLLSQFGFTRPELLANPFVSHPAWQVTALDGAGVVVDQVAEGQIDSSTNVGARQFSLSTTGGPGIAEVRFTSEGSGLTTFNALLLDDFVLTTNKSGFPPAVAITEPVAGQAVAAPPALTIMAAAYDAAGITGVGFYANGALVGAALRSPYTVIWTNPIVGNHILKAIATNALGLTESSPSVHISIQPSAYLFGISSQPVSQTVALGGSATFTVATTGTNGVAFQWSHNDEPISGATSSTLVLPPPITAGEAGTYTVVASANGTTLPPSTPAVLTVVAPPIVQVQPQAKTVATGAAVTLSASATGGGPFAWQWLLNGTSIPGATNNVYSITSTQPLDSGNYQVVAANGLTSASSAVAPVIVKTAVTIPETNDDFVNRAVINPLLGPVSDSNQLATTEPGEPRPDGLPGGKSIWFTWRATFSGTISLTTEGSDFDTLLAVYTGTQLRALKPVAADDDSGGYLTSLVTFNVTEGTDYQIDVDGYQGASGRVVLGMPAGTGYRILNPSPGDSVPAIVRGPASKIVAPNASVTLSVQAASATNLTYQWYFQGAPIPTATKSALTISHVQSGQVGLYYVVVANATGPAQSEPASVQIGLAQGEAITSTENKFVNTTNVASPSVLAYRLHPLALGGDTRGFSVAQTFSTVGATTEPGQPDPCGQVGGASQWFVYTAPAAGTLQVNTDGSSFNTLVGVYTGSGESFSDLTEVGCGYATNYLVEGQPSVVLQNLAKGTTYYILIEGFEGASGVAQLQIGLGATLTFRSLPPSQRVTAGGNATFTVTAIGSTPISYQWQLNGVNVPGATTATCKVANAQEAAEGNYTVIASNVLGPVTSSPPAQLTVQYAPLIVSGPTNEDVKLGAPARFTVTTLGVNVKTNPFHCQWYFDAAPLKNGTGLTLSIPVTRLTNVGTYYLVVSNTYGHVTSDSATLNVINDAAAMPVSTGVVASWDSGRPAQSAEIYSGLFYPADGATPAGAGFFTATLASQSGGAFSAKLLLDGESYPFTGKFDPSGDAQSLVPRAGKASLTAFLHLNLDSPDGPMTGVISTVDWRSILLAGRVEYNAASNPARANAGQFALVLAGGAGAPIGYLNLTNTANGSALVAGTLADGSKILRAAPTVKGAVVPLYAPLYSGKGVFLGWISFTNPPGQTDDCDAFWFKPGATNAARVLIVK